MVEKGEGWGGVVGLWVIPNGKLGDLCYGLVLD